MFFHVCALGQFCLKRLMLDFVCCTEKVPFNVLSMTVAHEYVTSLHVVTLKW